jgi:putative glutamine amidotransferase
MKLPIILVSQRVDVIAERSETRDAVDQALLQWIISTGSMPVPLPNVLSDEQIDAYIQSINPSGIVLSGGNNLGLYEGRDNTEDKLITWAKSSQTPLLGICRGMQKLAAWAGSTLIPVEGHVGLKHGITGELTGTVNSFHDFAVEQVPVGFRAIAFAEDGSVEAIKCQEKWDCEGWMWHPEREQPFRQEWRTRFRLLMNL